MGAILLTCWRIKSCMSAHMKMYGTAQFVIARAKKPWAKKPFMLNPQYISRIFFSVGSDGQSYAMTWVPLCKQIEHLWLKLDETYACIELNGVIYPADCKLKREAASAAGLQISIRRADTIMALNEPWTPLAALTCHRSTSCPSADFQQQNMHLCSYPAFSQSWSMCIDHYDESIGADGQ